jgi:hypothetical protein
MKLGTGKAIITPPIGTPLVGFGSRDHGSESVLDDLEVRVFWFQDADNAEEAVCIISADLLGFGDDSTQFLRDSISIEYGITPERILLAASHTHSGPQLEDSLVGTGLCVPEVAEQILALILGAVKDAQANTAEVTFHAGKGLLEGYAINRRGIENGESDIKPNYGGIRDDVVTALSCRDASTGDVKAVLFHFTCHASTMGTYEITGDYPGATRRFIEKELGNGAVAGFLPGCFGNVRSLCLFMGGEYFRGGQPKDLELYGKALGGEVVRVVREASTEVQPRLNGVATVIDLPLQEQPTREALEHIINDDPEDRTWRPWIPWLDKGKKVWAEFLMDKPFSPTRQLTLQRLDLADNVTLVAMGGEVCVEYGHFIKDTRPDAFMIPMGYSNGIIGYIPTAAMFPEGGYEPITSGMYFGLPAPFKPEIEEIIRKEISKILT